jgi:hypothetical protein
MNAALFAVLVVLGTLAVGAPVVGTAAACADETSCPPPSGPLDPRYLLCNLLDRTPFHCIPPM